MTAKKMVNKIPNFKEISILLKETNSNKKEQIDDKNMSRILRNVCKILVSNF